ncbi:MAG: YciI family protein [Neisseria sp.]|nr:YciI family protein [Neisseria sp.]
MYIINITVNDDVTEAQQAEMFPQHAAWFQKYFAAGNFLLLGPYTDTDKHNGVIIAHTDSREQLEAILNEDCYYPNFARYEIREFAPKMAAADIGKFVG